MAADCAAPLGHLVSEVEVFITLAELEGTLVAGKYRVKRRIGTGGMGAVYEGEHVEIGKRVAIKVIEHEHARSEELAARFRREARAASAVESEHIVHVFDVGQDEKIGLYMVMEFLAGEDLAARLEKAGGHIPVEEAVTIATQAARALGKAHAAGVVHRDLKPANLFLTMREDGTTSVKILDFGISKLVRPGTDGSSTLTRAGAVIGTPTYMSPEQAQGLEVDARTDLWSLASVLYEALAGRTPYAKRDTYEQMIVQIVTQKHAPLREVAPWVPEAIAAVVETALVHDVEGRASDAAKFAKLLADAAKMPRASASDPDLSAVPSPPSSGRAAGAAQASAATGASPPTGTGVVVGARTQLESGLPRKRSPAVWIAVGAVALAGAVAIAAVATREAPSQTNARTGLVGAAGPGTVSAPPSASATAPPITIIVSASASAEPAASSTAVAPAASATTTRVVAAPDGGARPAAARPAGLATPATTKASQGQYGAPGITGTY